MLTKCCLCSLLSSAIMMCCGGEASAGSTSDASGDSQKKAKTAVVLLVDPAPRDDYSYRKINHTKTISIMLYGFRDQTDIPVIQKSRKSLGAFFKQHLERIKSDVFSKDPESLQFVTGGADFDSTQIDRGISVNPAKMVGFTAPYGHLTLGGGYTWGEKNPVMLRLTKAEGYFMGASYDTRKVGYQISFLKSGDRVAGFKVGGSSIQYQSLMFGTSFRLTERLGLTATAQYRKDEDPLTTGDKQIILTLGTKWKF